MLEKKSFIYKAFIVSLICIFFFSTSCVSYRNMRPTGEYTVLNKEKLRDVYTFRTVQLPKPEKPLLVVELGKYPVFREHQKGREVGERKNHTKLVGCSAWFFGSIAMIKALSDMDSGSINSDLGTVLGAAGVVGIIWGFMETLEALGDKQWKPVSRFSLQDTEVKSETGFEPIANARIKASSPTIVEEWILSTDSQGRVFLDMPPIARLVRDSGDLAVTFQTMDAQKATNTFTIPQSFFADLKDSWAKTRPPNLITSLRFDDSKSRNPNQAIDGGEESHVIVSIENRGEGNALNVKLQINSNNPKIKISPTVDVGTIPPRDRIEKKIPLSAIEDIPDGKAIFIVQTKEERGKFDLPPKKLETLVRHLDRPKIIWVSPTDYRSEIKEETARISATITSESEIKETQILVNGVEVSLNGKPVNTEFRGAAKVAETRRHNIKNLIEFTVDAEVQLHPFEESEITIYAKNTSIDAISEKRIIYYKVPKYDLYLLSIGISNYKDMDLKLDFADDDAQAVSDIFETQRGKLFNNVYIKKLYNFEATRENILKGLEWLEKKGSPKDVTVLFIAAHGKVDNQGNFYIVPSDGSQYESSKGVTGNDILGTLRNLSGANILFLDACHSGKMGELYATRGGREVNEAIKYIAAAENNVIIFSATTGMGFSQESSKWGHGAFTNAIIAGLKEGGADYLNSGVIYLHELNSFVANEVMKLTKGQQKPEMNRSIVLPIYQWK